MSVAEYRAKINDLVISANDKKWFPEWIERARRFQVKGSNVQLAVDAKSTIEFLALLKAQGSGPWVRLQAVRSAASYISSVLNTSPDEIHPIVDRLAEIAASEQSLQTGSRKAVRAGDSAAIHGVVDGSENVKRTSVRSDFAKYIATHC